MLNAYSILGRERNPQPSPTETVQMPLPPTYSRPFHRWHTGSTRNVVGASETTSGSSHHEQRGLVLIETLVAAALLSIIGVITLAAVFTTIRGSALHRQLANAEIAARNYADALVNGPYVPCAQASDYANPPAFNSIDDYTIEIGQTDAAGPAVEF